MDFTWYLGEARHVGMALTNFSLQGSKQMILLLIKNNFLLLLFFFVSTFVSYLPDTFWCSCPRDSSFLGQNPKSKASNTWIMHKCNNIKSDSCCIFCVSFYRRKRALKVSHDPNCFAFFFGKGMLRLVCSHHRLCLILVFP